MGRLLARTDGLAAYSGRIRDAESQRITDPEERTVGAAARA